MLQREWQEWEDVELWHRLWSSSTPLWCVLIANGVVALTAAVICSSCRLFLTIPRRLVSQSSFIYPVLFDSLL